MWRGWEEVVFHDFAADKSLKREGGEHVQSEAAAIYVSCGRRGEGRTYNRAMFTMTLSSGKLLRTLPSVLSPKVRKPARAMTRQASMEMPVE